MIVVLQVFNTMTGTEEDFKPNHGNRVCMFVCGPTVYDHAHIGHARTYLAYDVIARYLKFKGYSLFYLMNITDVDDKIIDRARERKIHPLDLSNYFLREFLRDLGLLNALSINLFAKASEHIPEIIGQINSLLEKDCAYRVDGDVYFNISKFSDYGKLSHQKPEELRKHRIEPDPRKRDPSDFSLWKSRDKNELGWESPWGWGRPGWHIEDTAITERYFGAQYDIHGGAIELVFPHHEAEIAQEESISGKKPLVKYWVHTGMVNVKGQKMSKSLGNFVTIREVIEKYDSNVVRIFFASSHYRSPIDYNQTSLENARENCRRIVSAYAEAHDALARAKSKEDLRDAEFQNVTRNYWESFIEAMDDDFNTPLALSLTLSFVKKLETYVRQEPAESPLSEAIRVLDDFSSIFGIIILHDQVPQSSIPEAILELLVELRDDARKRGDWATSDKIREKLGTLQIFLEDTLAGTRWRYTDRI